MNERVDKFREFLLELSRGLTADDVEELKFVLSLSDAVAEQCTKAIHVFKVLERMGKMGPPNNLDCLKEKIRCIGRMDLVHMIGNLLLYILSIRNYPGLAPG